MGYIFLSEGDYQKANIYLDLGINYCEKVKDFNSLSQLFAEKANVMRRLGNAEDALKIAIKS